VFVAGEDASRRQSGGIDKVLLESCCHAQRQRKSRAVRCGEGVAKLHADGAYPKHTTHSGLERCRNP
jgi:hypothetical protein